MVKYTGLWEAVIVTAMWFLYLGFTTWVPDFAPSSGSTFNVFLFQKIALPALPNIETGFYFMLTLAIASFFIALFNRLNQQWIVAFFITVSLFWWAKGAVEGGDWYYLIMTFIVMLVFWNIKGTHNVINIYYVIIAVLFPISAVLTLVFPNMPIIADTVGSFLQIGIKSGLALIFLIASFLVKSESDKGASAKAYTFAKACFFTNAVIYFIELILLPMYEGLTPIMKQVYEVVSFQGLGIFLTIIGFLSLIITKWYTDSK